MQEFYYLFQRFCDVLALEGDEFSYLYQHHPEGAAFKILCKDASRFLHERLQGFHSVIAMSATLTPFPFYQDVLGMPPERSTSAEFPSPFPERNRRILVVPDVATTYRERQRDAPHAARIIETIVAQRPGNYGVFFPSFAYLRMVRAFMQRVPAHRIIEQARTMPEADRERVLQRLRQPDAEPVVLLGVQGGIFAEGVDYPGDMLSGVIVVGPGLPRVDGEQELIRAYYEEKYTQGFAYAYLYPGMNRVVQSAGPGHSLGNGRRHHRAGRQAVCPRQLCVAVPVPLVRENAPRTGDERFPGGHRGVLAAARWRVTAGMEPQKCCSRIPRNPGIEMVQNCLYSTGPHQGKDTNSFKPSEILVCTQDKSDTPVQLGAGRLRPEPPVWLTGRSSPSDNPLSSMMPRARPHSRCYPFATNCRRCFDPQESHAARLEGGSHDGRIRRKRPRCRGRTLHPN